MIRRLSPLIFLVFLLVACGGGGDTVDEPEPDVDTPVARAGATGVPTSPTAETGSPPQEPASTLAPPGETPTLELPSPEAQPTTGTVEPTAEPSATASPPLDPSAATARLEPVVSGLRLPVDIDAAGDGSGRLFVIEKEGAIRVVESGVLLDRPFLDLRGGVALGNEQGLLGMVFEPGRPDRFYTNYTDRSGTTIISRWRVTDDPTLADGDSEEVLLRVPQPAANHNAGHLAFGPDGYLWIGLGDGGAAADRFGNGQNLSTWLGSMLRIDVSGEQGYTIPADNPYVNGGGAPEIWAIGLRNPWRYSFDPATGQLWLADVGQNRIEEVNRVGAQQAALNYGWPMMEGPDCFQSGCSADGLVLPVTSYDHSVGCSITGGNVYRGGDYPTLQGLYFFSDYCSGTLWAIPADAPEWVAPTVMAQSRASISAFGEDDRGELYATALEGTLYRVVGE